MSHYQLLLTHLGTVLHAEYLVPLLAGTVAGVVGGALPGVTITMTVIMVLPFTFGLDPLQVANEGKLLAFVPASASESVLAAMRSHPLGASACVIGTVVADHPGMVVARTALGGTRVISMPIGEQLPRIC